MDANHPPPSRSPLRVFYVRHGETLWSLSGQHTGATELTLTAEGEAQSRRLAPWLASHSFSRVLTSPRMRARATCDLAGFADRAEVEPDLAEWSYGDYEGRRSAEIRRDRPDWNIFLDGCPNGESPEAMSARVDRVVARLRALEGDVALFSHGHFGAVFCARWLGLALALGQHFELGPASMSVLGFARNHPETPVVALWNAAPAAEARDLRLG